MLRLDSSKYPSKDPPDIEIRGYFNHFASFIVDELRKRFDPGSTVLFDWYYLIKDEIFIDSENPFEYS